MGLALLLIALWLLRFDIARKTVRRTGLTRFIALNLLIGYVWLVVSGLLMLIFGQQAAGPVYDAQLHTLFLGFVFGMIFGHTPVIFPAVWGGISATGRTSTVTSGCCTPRWRCVSPPTWRA